MTSTPVSILNLTVVYSVKSTDHVVFLQHLRSIRVSNHRCFLCLELPLKLNGHFWFYTARHKEVTLLAGHSSRLCGDDNNISSRDHVSLSNFSFAHCCSDVFHSLYPCWSMLFSSYFGLMISLLRLLLVSPDAVLFTAFSSVSFSSCLSFCDKAEYRILTTMRSLINSSLRGQNWQVSASSCRDSMNSTTDSLSP